MIGTNLLKIGQNPGPTNIPMNLMLCFLQTLIQHTELGMVIIILI